MSAAGERTTLGITAETRERFNEAKPYGSMSAEEFLEVLLDEWEGQR